MLSRSQAVLVKGSASNKTQAGYYKETHAHTDRYADRPMSMSRERDRDRDRQRDRDRDRQRDRAERGTNLKNKQKFYK